MMPPRVQLPTACPIRHPSTVANWFRVASGWKRRTLGGVTMKTLIRYDTDDGPVYAEVELSEA
jgi:hypothetical protein